MNPTEELRGRTPVRLIDESAEEILRIVQELESVNLRMFAPKQQRFDEWALALRESLRFGNEIKNRIVEETEKRSRYNDTKQVNRRQAVLDAKQQKEELAESIA